MSDQSDPAALVVENEPAVVASADPVEAEPAQVDPAPAEPVPVADAPVQSAPVDIQEDWASLHWKQIVSLARKIAGDIEITVEDARRIIGDELATRAATETDDGLVAMTKNGDTLRINPVTVEAHKRAGWALA